MVCWHLARKITKRRCVGGPKISWHNMRWPADLPPLSLKENPAKSWLEDGLMPVESACRQPPSPHIVDRQLCCSVHNPRSTDLKAVLREEACKMQRTNWQAASASAIMSQTLPECRFGLHSQWSSLLLLEETKIIRKLASCRLLAVRRKSNTAFRTIESTSGAAPPHLELLFLLHLRPARRDNFH